MHVTCLALASWFSVVLLCFWKNALVVAHIVNKWRREEVQGTRRSNNVKSYRAGL